MTSVLGRPSSVLCASRRLQRDQQILDNIVRMLQAAGESHQPVADADPRARPV
jgi:chitinase